MLKETGRTLDDIAELLGVDPSTISRWLRDAPLEGEREPGPVETKARAQVVKRDSKGEADQTWDALLIANAAIVDVGVAPNANGAERGAAVAAGKELRAMLDSLGETSGIDDLRKALGSDASE